MRKPIKIPPPEDFTKFSPSELFRFYFQVGHWTEDSFSDAFQDFTRGKLVSTVTINKWKNRDVIPTRYSSAFLRMIETVTAPDLAKSWVTAFETVWALHSAGRTQDNTQKESSELSNLICAQHRNWIQELYFGKFPNQNYSSSDIYVPIQLGAADTAEATPQDIEDIIALPPDADLTATQNDWIFISGGPGAGKSMAALHLAQTFCSGDVFPIYLRGDRLSDIDIDMLNPSQPIGDSFSASSFLKHFRLSSFKKASLILDGIDQIYHGSQASQNPISQLIKTLKMEQAACAAHNKTLQIMALGQESHVSFYANQISLDNARRFIMCGLDGSLRNETASETGHGADLRGTWWDKYLDANGYMEDQSLPDFLSVEYDEFFQFGRVPLLTFLMCQSGLKANQNDSSLALPHERINALTNTSNRNQIFKTILEHQTLNLRHVLDEKLLLRVFQYIAVTVWHNKAGQTVSLRRIYEDVDDPEIKGAFTALKFLEAPGQTSPIFLMSGQHSALSQGAANIDTGRVQFVHEGFSEYLISTYILDKFSLLIASFGTSVEFEIALKDWIKLSSEGHHGPSLADFCQKEAALRFDEASNSAWDVALTIIREHIHPADLETRGLSLFSQMQNATALLFFVWSCFNLERLKRTGAAFPMSGVTSLFNSSDFKLTQQPKGLNFKSSFIDAAEAQDVRFLTQSLSALHLKSADMSQLNFTPGHVESLTTENSRFAMTQWSHVKVTGSHFFQTVFPQSIFHHWRVLDTNVLHCLFQGSRFQASSFSGCEMKGTFFSQCHFADVEFFSSHFENVIFDRCIFSQCAFAESYGAELLLDAKFRHCTFLGMDGALANIPPENIRNSIPEIGIDDIKMTAPD